jgi:ribosomal protein S18 acetylase RimI-like enzyme
MEPRDLYGLPLDRFVPERTALAKKLRRAGQPEQAAEVAAMRKPSVAAWAVNQLLRTQGRAVTDLLGAGDDLQRAQSQLLAGRGDPAALRQAVVHERDAVNGLVEKARGLLTSQGHELTSTTLERVAETLHAAALDQEARARVSEGSLGRELRHVGLGDTGSVPARRGTRRGTGRRGPAKRRPPARVPEPVPEPEAPTQPEPKAPPELPVRRATRRDARVIARMLDAFNREFEEPTPGPTWLAKRVAQLLTEDTLVLLGGAGPDALALMRFRPSLWSAGLECYLAELYVAQDKRGQGLGRALMLAVLEAARERGADRIELGTSEDDRAARALYESLGFINRERGPDGPITYFYELELKPADKR